MKQQLQLVQTRIIGSAQFLKRQRNGGCWWTSHHWSQIRKNSQYGWYSKSGLCEGVDDGNSISAGYETPLALTTDGTLLPLEMLEKWNAIGGKLILP